MLFAIARFAVSIRPATAGDRASPAVTIVRDYLDVSIVAGLAALFLLTFVIRPFSIPSISMIPTLRVGNVLLADELAYRVQTPQPQEIALFVPPVESHGNDFVKRVIGVPGDTIRIANGIVYRNDLPLREPYLNEPPAYDLEIKNYSIYVDGAALLPAAANIPPKSAWQAPNRVPAGFYLVLGDNRNYSDDSHIWGFAQLHGRFAAGPLAHRPVTAAFSGRAFLVIWPLDHLHILH